MTRAGAVAAAAALVLSGCATSWGAGTASSGTGGAEPTRPVTVFAASSLAAAFPEVARLDPTLDVRFTFDGSPTLVDQLAGGARADVLATADEATMARAADGGLVGPAATFATNTAVLIVPRGNPGSVTGLDASLRGRKLVVCAPVVPCGATAVGLAADAGITLAPVSQEQKVTDVRGKVASGEADAGIVFATDAAAAGEAVETIRLPGAAAHATRYRIAVVAEGSDADAARAFVALVTGDAGREVLARHGFGAP